MSRNSALTPASDTMLTDEQYTAIKSMLVGSTSDTPDLTAIIMIQNSQFHALTIYETPTQFSEFRMVQTQGPILKF